MKMAKEAKKWYDSLNLTEENNPSGFGMYPIEMFGSDLTIAEYKVLQYLIFSAGPKKYCWPSQQTMAKKLNFDRKTINKAIKELCKRNLILKKTFQKENNHEVNSYVILASPYISTTDPDINLKWNIGKSKKRGPKKIKVEPTGSIDQVEPTSSQVEPTSSIDQVEPTGSQVESLGPRGGIAGTQELINGTNELTNNIEGTPGSTESIPDNQPENVRGTVVPEEDEATASSDLDKLVNVFTSLYDVKYKPNSLDREALKDWLSFPKNDLNALLIDVDTYWYDFQPYLDDYEKNFSAKIDLLLSRKWPGFKDFVQRQKDKLYKEDPETPVEKDPIKHFKQELREAGLSEEEIEERFKKV